METSTETEALQKQEIQGILPLREIEKHPPITPRRVSKSYLDIELTDKVTGNDEVADLFIAGNLGTNRS